MTRSSADDVETLRAGHGDEAAATLLRRCCVGPQGRGCEGSCVPADRATEGPPVVRDPGALPDSGVTSVRVLRDIEARAGREVASGNAVQILSDGVDSFGAMLDLVRRARSSVRFENFIFRADAVGRAFAAELRKRAEAGVSTRVLHDPVGSLMARRAPVDLLFRRSAAEVRMFNLAWPTRRGRTLGRDHRKLVVADDCRMVAGGLCLADPWAGNCVRHCTWRDSAILVEGPAAAEGAASFDRAWAYGAPLVTPLTGPPPRAGPSLARGGDVPVRIVADAGADRRTIHVLERVMDAAEREILITNPHFIPPYRLMRALLRARTRGVQVSVLMPGRNNHLLAALAAEARLRPLLEHGVSVFRWMGSMIHAKSVVVDGAWTLIGSSNLDSFSLRRNMELNVEIPGPAVGGIMVDLFRRDCMNSERFDLDDWHARRSLRRLAGRAAAFAAPWL